MIAVDFILSAILKKASSFKWPNRPRYVGTIRLESDVIMFILNQIISSYNNFMASLKVGLMKVILLR